MTARSQEYLSLSHGLSPPPDSASPRIVAQAESAEQALYFNICLGDTLWGRIIVYSQWWYEPGTVVWFEVSSSRPLVVRLDYSRDGQFLLDKIYVPVTIEADGGGQSDFFYEKGVGVGIHYPTPIHKQPLYQKLGYSDSLPVAETASQEVLSLPIHPSLTKDDLDTIVAAIASL